LLKKFFLLIAIVSLNFAVDGEISLDELKNMKPTEKVEVKPAPKSEPKAPKNEISIDDLKRIAPTDEANLDIDDSTLHEAVKVTDLLLTISKVPKKAYVNQIYRLDLKADIQQDINVDLNLTLAKNDALLWINEANYAWIENTPGVFETTLWFEANSTEAKLESLTVEMARNGELFQKASKKAPNPAFEVTPEKENFSHIVADELHVLSHKTAEFDDESNMMTVQLNVKNGNLGTFFIDSNETFVRQSMGSITGNFNNQKGFAFLVIPKEMTSVNFNYFNLKTQSFENFSLNVKVEKDDLSTQTDINPKDDQFKIYKAIAVYTLAAILVVMFLLSRNFTPLIFAALLILAYMYFQKPMSSGKLKADTQVRILPIKNSTIFLTTEKEEKVEIFEENDGYKKIMFKDGKIGWVEKANLE